MSGLETLAAQAVVGVARQAPVWPDTGGAVGATLHELIQQRTDPASALLGVAGVLAVCGAAGYCPPTHGRNSAPPCPPETLPAAQDPPLAAALAAILADGPERLQAEALRRLAGAGARWPERLLPEVLELGRRNRALRPCLQATLGQRGPWLAGLNPAWAYAVGPVGPDRDIALWETGTLEQRAAYLRHCRSDDPGRGRELYLQALPELGAKERAALLMELAVGLGPDDEATLETTLKDRAKEVRIAAAALLVRLPDSAYARRMAARLDACLGQTRKLLRTVWTVEPPETSGLDWKADALEESPPKGEALGQRAWWLYQLTRNTPLAWWETRLELTAADILEWGLKSEWRNALWRGWLDAAETSAAALWLEAFLARKPPKGVHYDYRRFLRHLPPHACEHLWLDLMARENAGAGLALACESLPLDSGAVSAEFAQAALGQVADYLARREATWDYRLRETLPQFACLIPPELFETIEATRPLDCKDVHPSLTETVARFHAVLERRALLHQHPLLASADP
ncbi:hypothetical protein SAMN02949497_4718 [Methylomagnum ishizawai]|uniref:Uncharacterized protein n=1 Tax=Methylomagnum ishizawai TaxID=1760988 RepID=A0A1Y6D3V8_9GAMM|nr:DUF5691 domain-containing protein [Methylomagnum ishizawai]SMF97296.1 hypothetical protein SAMN02949497_4718 [Methylomagnum ishizawai]